VDALAGQRVEIDASVATSVLPSPVRISAISPRWSDAADHLHVVMALAEHALGRLAHRGEGFGQQLVERLAGGQPLAELDGLAASSSSVSAEIDGSNAAIL
jgi:hypothetical protein